MLEKLLIILFICLFWGIFSYKICKKFFNWKARKDFDRLEKDIEESFKDDLNAQKMVNEWYVKELKKEGLEDED